MITKKKIYLKPLNEESEVCDKEYIVLMLSWKKYLVYLIDVLPMVTTKIYF